MKQPEILAILLTELREHNIAEDINLDDEFISEVKFDDLKLDSLDILQLAMNMEDKLGIALEVAEFPQDATLIEFSRFLTDLRNH